MSRPRSEITIARRAFQDLWGKNFPDAEFTVRNIRKALSNPQVSGKEEWLKLNSHKATSLVFWQTAIQILTTFEDRYLK